MVLALTRGITIAAAERVNTLGPKLAQLVDLATISGADATNGTTAAIPWSQSATPTGVDNQFWQYTNNYTLLAVYGGASSQKRWDPIADGCSLKNQTGGTRSTFEAVCINSSTANLSADSFCFTGNIFIGALAEGPANGSFGMFKSFGKMKVKASGAIARGDFIKVNTANSTYQVVSAGSTLDGACGIALEAAAAGEVLAVLFGHNKT